MSAASGPAPDITGERRRHELAHEVGYLQGMIEMSRDMLRYGGDTRAAIAHLQRALDWLADRRAKRDAELEREYERDLALSPLPDVEQ